MSGFTEVLKLVGAGLGLVAFVWNVWITLRSYLTLTLEVRKPEGGEVIIKVSVANPGLASKMISYAVLLITPEKMSLSDAITQLFDQVSSEPARSRNGDKALARLFRHGGDARYKVQGCALIPLKELYQEQAMVGPSESVGYVCSVNVSEFQPDVTHIVRFLVFISYAGVYLRWRFTADALRISASKSA